MVQTSQPSSKTTPIALAWSEGSEVRKPEVRRMLEKSAFQCTTGPENCYQRAGVLSTAAHVRSGTGGAACVNKAA